MKVLGFVALVLVGGCALTSNSPPVEVREFSPERAETSAERSVAATAPGVELRVGRVRSSANLRRHIVYRVSSVEVGEYEDWQWTENPEEYLRRAATRALFDDRAMVQAVAARHPTLDLELTAFEEVRRGDARLGRVQVSYVLRDEQHVLDSGEVTVERSARNAEISSVVFAISSALVAATNEVGDRVAKKLAVGVDPGQPPH